MFAQTEAKSHIHEVGANALQISCLLLRAQLVARKLMAIQVCACVCVCGGTHDDKLRERQSRTKQERSKCGALITRAAMTEPEIPPNPGQEAEAELRLQV